MFVVIGGILFWAGLLGLLHTYIFYPLSLLLLARKSPPPPEDPVEWPSVSILVPAYNEETHIGAKTENCLALDYPSEKLEVLIGSDASSDRTAEIVKSYADSRVRLFEMERRTGKVGVLNRLAREAQGDIFLFTDANTFLDASAARKLVRHFGNPAVGVVSGRTDRIPPKDATEVRGENLYRKYEIFLKTLESNLGGTCGAFGGLYAVRREQFAPFPQNVPMDDLVQSLLAVKCGKRVIFEPSARSFEVVGTTLQEEFRRRARFGIVHTLAGIGHMAHPRFGATAYILFSHKILRWVSPFLLIAVLVGSLLLQHIPFYRIVLWMQIIWYGMAILGGILNRFSISLPGPTLIYHFTLLTFAFLLSFVRGLWQPYDAIWERSERTSVHP